MTDCDRLDVFFTDLAFIANTTLVGDTIQVDAILETRLQPTFGIIRKREDYQVVAESIVTCTNRTTQDCVFESHLLSWLDYYCNNVTHTSRQNIFCDGTRVGPQPFASIKTGMTDKIIPAIDLVCADPDDLVYSNRTAIEVYTMFDRTRMGQSQAYNRWSCFDEKKFIKQMYDLGFTLAPVKLNISEFAYKVFGNKKIMLKESSSRNGYEIKLMSANDGHDILYLKTSQTCQYYINSRQINSL